MKLQVEIGNYVAIHSATPPETNFKSSLFMNELIWHFREKEYFNSKIYKEYFNLHACLQPE